MDKYLKNNLVEIKKTEISNNYHILITYFNVGKELYEACGGSRAKYGEGVIKKYSIHLTNKYGKFYSVRNLEIMRQLYVVFPNTNTLYSKLNWSLFKEILPIKNESKRIDKSITK